MSSGVSDGSYYREVINGRYRLLVIAMCFLVVVTTSLKHLWPVFIPYIEAYFSTTRSISVLPFSLLNIVNIVGFLATNYLKELLGLRKLLSLTALLMSLGLLITASSINIVMLVISFALIYGLGNSFAYVLAVSVGVKWSRKGKSGISAGVITSAYSFGVLSLSPLTVCIIEYFRSWRAPLIIYAVVTGVVVAIATKVIKEPSPEAFNTGRPSSSIANLVKSKEFISVSTVMLLTTLFDGLVSGNIVPLVKELAGADPMTASLVMSTYSAVALITRVVIGMVSDYLGVLKTLLVIYSLASLNAVFFRLYSTLPLIVLGTSLSALLFSTNVALSPIITSLIWGSENLESTYGPLLSVIVCGAFLGSLIGGLSRDLTGSYYSGITLTAITLITGTALLALTSKYLRNYVR